jgi:hypothetical protein
MFLMRPHISWLLYKSYKFHRSLAKKGNRSVFILSSFRSESLVLDQNFPYILDRGIKLKRHNRTMTSMQVEITSGCSGYVVGDDAGWGALKQALLCTPFWILKFPI